MNSIYTKKRNRRLFKIYNAQKVIEHSLLKLRREGRPALEDDAAFQSLCYLIRLARRSPLS